MAIRTLPMYDIQKPVGPGKPNLAEDVRLVQALLKALQAADDFLLEGLPPIAVIGLYTTDLGSAILQCQKKAKAVGARNVVDGYIDPLPSRSGLAGDWDSKFRSGVSSTLVFLCYRLFRFNREAYMKLGDTLNLKWTPDPFDLST